MAGWGDISGQQGAVDRLRRALREGRVPHAYLFTGPVGVGKLETARLLTQALQCRSAGDSPCGSCEPCRKVATERHPDVRTVRVPEGRTRVVIEQVRELQSGMAYKPFEGRHRVILVPDAELMTEEAANALLKTLEEPPELTHFVLTSSQPKSLLDTIRSRCQQIRFAPLGRQEVARRLREQDEVSPALAEVAAGLCEGSIGQARELLASGLLAERAEMLRAVHALTPRQPLRILELAEAWSREKEQLATRLDLLLSHYRDLLVQACGGPRESKIHQDLADMPVPGRKEALRCLDLLIEVRRAVLERNANTRLALERLLLGLASGGR